MIRKPSFMVALAGFYGLLGVIAALFCYAVWATLEPADQQAIRQILDQRAGALIFIVLLTLVVLGMLFEQLYRRHVTLPRRLSEQLAVMLEVNRGLRLQPE